MKNNAKKCLLLLYIASTVKAQALIDKCGEVSHYPGTSFYGQNADEQIEIEPDAGG